VAVGCSGRGGGAGASSSVEDVSEDCTSYTSKGYTGYTSEGYTGYTSEGCRRIGD
jgi:hypothetical protein